MAIKHGSKFKCMICGEIFSREVDCDLHRDSKHSIIYVPFTAPDLENLRRFLYIHDEKLLTPTLVKTILAYATRSAKKKMTNSDISEPE